MAIDLFAQAEMLVWMAAAGVIGAVALRARADGRVAENQGMPTRAQELLAASVDPSTLREDGRYTVPRSWGVYRISAPGNRGRAFRSGNHPVRLRELEREFSGVGTVALFDREDLALELAKLGNEDPDALGGFGGRQ